MGVDESPNEIDSEGNEMSEEDSLNVQVGEDTGTADPQTHPTPEEINRTIGPPLGIDGDKLVEKQEPKPKPARRKVSKQEQLTHKLYNQLIKKLQSDKTYEDLRQIQKRLAQVEKNTTNIELQQQLGKELLTQVRLMQRRLEKIDNTISRSKTKGNVKRTASRKVTKSKRSK